MTDELIVAYALGSLFQGSIFWFSLQLWRASTSSPKARSSWVRVVEPMKVHWVFPLIRWGCPVICCYAFIAWALATILVFGAIVVRLVD
jgi:hypothetical protein